MNQAGPLFSWRLASADGKPVTTSSGLQLIADGRLPAEGRDVVFIPSCHYLGDRQLLSQVEQLAKWSQDWLLEQYGRGAWMTAGCSGAFALAKTGLLNDKMATTSWWLFRLFRQHFPKVDLRTDELVTEDGPFICAGPVNAHFNLALRVVERLAGRPLATLCAKTLLVDANRPSQLPYMMLQAQVRHTDDLVLRAQDWMRKNIREVFGMQDVVRALNSSQRTLIRRFKRATGLTPVEYLQELRLEAAKNLLEVTDLSLEAIVERVGYQDASSFRRLFKQHTTVSPREYRQRFGIRPAADAVRVPDQ